MAEEIIVLGENREQKYQNLLPQICTLLAHETKSIPALGNFCAVVKETFQFLWIGFYILENDELILHVFQGPMACSRIKVGKGVCGKAVELSKPIIVPNVHEFTGHIACSSLSNSEIVLPIYKNEKLVAILDIDSVYFNDFSEIDQMYLEKMCLLLERFF